MEDAYRTLFRRHRSNPILTAVEWPYPVHSVFNPGATLLNDGRTLLLCRCEDRRGFSHFCKAISENGVNGWKIDTRPTLISDPANYPEELWGIEDPRITYLDEMQEYVIAYTAYSHSGPGVSLAKTKDFVTFERLGLVMQPEDKDAALLPMKFDGQYALIHRPVSSQLGAHIWMSFSPDLRNWGGHQLILPARRGAWWDANKVGLSPPPIKTDKGWLMLYHGVRVHASGSIYRVGLALFDLRDPSKCLLRGETWVFGPETDYELSGDVGSVVFPGGYTIGPDGDTLNLYYGAADTSIALAQASIGELLAWIENYGSTQTGTTGDLESAVHFYSGPQHG